MIPHLFSHLVMMIADAVVGVAMFVIIWRRPDVYPRSLIVVLGAFLLAASAAHAFNAFIDMGGDMLLAQVGLGLTVVSWLLPALAVCWLVPTLLRAPSPKRMANLEAAHARLDERLTTAQERRVRRTGLLTTVLDMMREGVIVADPGGDLLSLNRAAVDILGTTSAAHEPRALVEQLEPRDAATGARLAEACLPLARAGRGETVTAARILVRTARLDDLELAVDAHPMVNARGEPQGAVCMFRVVSAG